MKNKGGRPSKYTTDLAERICKRLADGETPTEIGRDPEMPDCSTIRDWALKNKEFGPMYAHARELGWLKMADEIIDIADDSRDDWITKKTKGGNEFKQVNREATERSKLRVDARKWLLAKALPKVYGDKLETTHNAGDGFKALWEALGSGVLDKGKK